MALSNRKITDGDISTYGVVSAPDRLTGTAAENKAVFDKLIKESVKEAVNGLVDDLLASTAAGELGASAPQGLTGANVQAVLESIKAYTDSSKVAKETGKGLSANDYTDEDKAKLSGVEAGAEANVIEEVKVNGAALTPTGKAVEITVPTKVSDLSNDSGFAKASDVLAKDNTAEFTPTGDYQPCTKKYADNIAAQAGAVTSVFGRAGAVAAQSGDYTAEQVGAAPAAHASQHTTGGSDPLTASDVGAAPSSHTHSPNDLTAAVPVSKGGTGYNNPTQAAYALRKQVRVGIGSTSTTGYFPVARWDINGTYQTIQTMLAVGENGQAGNNILSINLRTANVSGTILTSETFMTWLSPSFEKTFAPENWFIDNSVAGTATLYVYLSGSYITRNVGVIFEALSTENSRYGVTLINNYANAPVEGTNYVTSITKTVTAKAPITASTTDLTAGTSSLATGQLYLCYE